MKDPANYGQLTITHAISIINDGAGDATIFASSGDSIDIQSGAGDAVFIKGLILDGVGNGYIGLHLTSGGNLKIANCTIKGFANGGISIQPSSGTTTVSITDTIVLGNGNVGVRVSPSGSGSVRGTLTRVQADNNANGLDADSSYTTGSIFVAIDDSLVSANTGSGVSSYGDKTTVTLNRITARFNGTDVSRGAGNNTIITFQNNEYQSVYGALTPSSLH